MSEETMDGYVRVSVVGGRRGDRFQSPTEQRDAIQRWADANGVRIAEWHEDLDQSGGTMDRPGMNAALERVRRGHTGGIVVARLDRFARTAPGGLATIYELHQRGARVVSVAESIDPATPIGRAMLGLLLIMAEWFRDQAIDHLNASMARAISQRRFPGRTPFGYKRDDEGHVVLDEETAPLCRLIFEKRAAGMGWREIARVLDDMQAPTPRDRPFWHSSTVYGIVHSEAAKGVFVGPGKVRVEDAWPAIVSDELWADANRVMGVRDNDPKHRDRLAAGVARCAGCRYVLSRTVNTEGYVSYGCTRKGCPARSSVGAVLLDEVVRDAIDDRLAGLTAAARAASEDTEGVRLRAALRAARDELEAWVSDLDLRRALGPESWRDGIIARAKARDEAEVVVSRHDAETGIGLLASSPDERAFRMDDLTWDRQREITRTAFHSVWLRRSPLRGPKARRHVASRLHLVWADDPSPPVLPAANGPAVGQFEWPAM